MSVCKSFREKSAEENIGIGLDITNGCNLGCVHCYYRKNPSALRFLSFEQFKTIVRMAEGRFSELYLLGGEPTLHPLLSKIVEFSLGKMNSIMLVTNGLRLTDKKYCQKIASPRFDISMHRRAIDNQARELVDRLSGRPGAFAKNQLAWENVELYWQGKICVQVNLLRPLVEAGHVMDVFKWAREKGYEPVIEMVKASSNFERNDKLDLSPEEVRAVYQRMYDYDRKNYPSKTPMVVVPPVYGHPCTLMETSLHIAIDGRIVLCVGNETISYGNVFEDGIEQALNSPLRLAIQDYRNWIVGPCRACPHFDYCHGGCRGNAKWETGCPRASNPYCWHHSPNLILKDMVPETCKGCLLEDNPGCSIKV